MHTSAENPVMNGRLLTSKEPKVRSILYIPFFANIKLAISVVVDVIIVRYLGVTCTMKAPLYKTYSIPVVYCFVSWGITLLNKAIELTE